jgi:hypothetical protein
MLCATIFISFIVPPHENSAMLSLLYCQNVFLLLLFHEFDLKPLASRRPSRWVCPFDNDVPCSHSDKLLKR